MSVRAREFVSLTGLSESELRARRKAQTSRRGKRILDMKDAGLTAREIQRELGLTARQFYFALRRARSER